MRYGRPEAHKPPNGAEASAVPLAGPHAPSTDWVVSHEAFDLPELHDHRQGFAPETGLALPDSHRPEVGATCAGCPEAKPHTASATGATAADALAEARGAFRIEGSS